MIPAAPRRPGRAVAIAPESEALLAAELAAELALAATELAELEAELATELTLLETLAAEEADDEAEEEAEDSELAEPVMLLRTEPVQLLVWERAERRFNGMSDLGRL
jgi:hypothetical protein